MSVGRLDFGMGAPPARPLIGESHHHFLVFSFGYGWAAADREIHLTWLVSLVWILVTEPRPWPVLMLQALQASDGSV
jgi:hypothetical protein